MIHESSFGIAISLGFYDLAVSRADPGGLDIKRVLKDSAQWTKRRLLAGAGSRHTSQVPLALKAQEVQVIFFN